MSNKIAQNNLRKLKKFDILKDMIVEVIISSNAKDLNRIFDYNVPPKFEGIIKIGSKVLVPFGTMKRSQEGFVTGIKEKSDYKVKDIINVEKRNTYRRKGNSRKAHGK